MPSAEPTVHALSQPPKIADSLAAQQKDYDCTPCRLMGMQSNMVMCLSGPD